jgi:transposase-like protein
MNNLLKMKRKHDKLIDDLLQSYKVDLNQDKDGSLKLSNINDITKDVIRRLLDHIHQSELEVKLGYKPNDQKSRLVSDNYRNGSYTKTVKSAQGNIELNIPRDRDGEYTPQMVPKYQNTIIGLESKIINLIQDGLSYSGIQDALKDMYGINIDPHAMTDIANKISTFLEE